MASPLQCSMLCLKMKLEPARMNLGSATVKSKERAISDPLSDMAPNVPTVMEVKAEPAQPNLPIMTCLFEGGAVIISVDGERCCQISKRNGLWVMHAIALSPLYGWVSTSAGPASLADMAPRIFSQKSLLDCQRAIRVWGEVRE